jgi:hypothetical protein
LFAVYLLYLLIRPGHLEKMLADKKVAETTKAEIQSLLPKVRMCFVE